MWSGLHEEQLLPGKLRVRPSRNRRGPSARFDHRDLRLGTVAFRRQGKAVRLLPGTGSDANLRLRLVAAFKLKSLSAADVKRAV